LIDVHVFDHDGKANVLIRFVELFKFVGLFGFVRLGGPNVLGRAQSGDAGRRGGGLCPGVAEIGGKPTGNVASFPVER